MLDRFRQQEKTERRKNGDVRPFMPLSFVATSCRSFELGVEQFSEPNTGVTKRSSASLIDDDELGGYLVVTNMISPGRNLSLVDARRLQPGGHNHIQVCTWRGFSSLGARKLWACPDVSPRTVGVYSLDRGSCAFLCPLLLVLFASSSGIDNLAVFTPPRSKENPCHHAPTIGGDVTKRTERVVIR